MHGFGNEAVPQVGGFKYLLVWFRSEGRMELDLYRRIGAASAVMQTLYWSVAVRRELSRKARLCLLVDLCSCAHLWAQIVGSYRKNKTVLSLKRNLEWSRWRRRLRWVWIVQLHCGTTTSGDIGI